MISEKTNNMCRAFGLTGLCSNFLRNHSENFRRESLSHDAPTDQINEKINHASIKSPTRSNASGTADLSDYELNKNNKK